MTKLQEANLLVWRAEGLRGRAAEFRRTAAKLRPEDRGPWFERAQLADRRSDELIEESRAAIEEIRAGVGI
jgi:hypothetical protein